MPSPRALLTMLSMAVVVGAIAWGSPASAEPSAVCSPAHPISANEVEVRIYGATWCSACRATETFFSSIGASDTTPVTVSGNPVTVRLTHRDVDTLSSAERAEMRGRGVPEIHLVVRGQVVHYRAGAITSRGELDSFVGAGLSTGGCVIGRARR